MLRFLGDGTAFQLPADTNPAITADMKIDRPPILLALLEFGVRLLFCESDLHDLNCGYE